MTVQKCSSSSPSLGSIISVLSVLFYCAGFIRIEMKLNQHEGRINAVENVVTFDLTDKNRAEVLSKKTNEILQEVFHMNRISRHRRQVHSGSNTSTTISKINKLLSEGRVHLCQTKGQICPAGPPGPPGPPGPRGKKGAQGKRGHKGRAGNKGDRGIMGSPGKSGKQGIMGPAGLKGQTGPKGEKGHMGPPGMPGMKGEPGESISSPTLIVSPSSLTVNESESAIFQCSVSGNPEPTVTWSKLSSPTVINGLAVSSGKLHLMKVTGSDSGVYQCTAKNILGQTRRLVRLIVNVRPSVTIHPGPIHVQEGTNITLPKCHVTGYPPPVVTWSRVVHPLPQGRVQSKSGELTIFDVQKVDSDIFFCKASNLLGTVIKQTLVVVVQLPKFIVKPPSKIKTMEGGNLTLNCSATGDPQPVITWKRQGAQLPVGRTYRINDTLIIRGVTLEDAGIYVCVAVSAGVFDVEAVSNIQVVYSDCSSLLKAGHSQSGVYSVDPDGQGALSVYCDMLTDGGGWTVFQRRQDGSVDFYRGWNDYKSGFGQLTAEFWLGNDKIHRLTANRASSLRVELEDWSGARVYAKYGKFSIGDEQAQYRLTVGSYSGSAGDSLAYHNNMAFSTKDRDHDQYSSNCAVERTGAWWYNACYVSNLNGQYLGKKIDIRGARWHSFRSALSLMFTEMKLRSSS